MIKVLNENAILLMRNKSDENTITMKQPSSIACWLGISIKRVHLISKKETLNL